MVDPIAHDRALEGLPWGAALLDEYAIPDHLRPGLERYLKLCIRPGGFLRAVLENDLQNAVLRAATPGALDAIPCLVRFLTYEAPANAWGDPGTVAAWVARATFTEAEGKLVT